MAYDKVVDSASLDSKLTQVADAIRTKGNTSADLQFPSGFISAIQAIQTGTELQIIVTVQSGATVTATKGSLSVSGTSVNNSCTLTVPEEGDWTVSATLGGQTSTSNIVNVVSSYDTSLVFISTTLNDNSWEAIHTASDAGTGENYWSIGDRKAVMINGVVGNYYFQNIEIYAFIIGFNHNQELEGTNRIHFQFAKTALSGGTDICLCNNNVYGKQVTGGAAFVINNAMSNSGGWESSIMRTKTCGTNFSDTETIIRAVPEELRSALKPVTKYTDNTGNYGSAASNVTATTDYFFLLSEYETFGNISRANTNEASKQAQYAYYSAGNSKIKYKYDETSTPVYCWLRSPDRQGSNAFVLVTRNGEVTNDVTNYSYGFAPGFCV